MKTEEIIISDIIYISQKRDAALHQFNEGIKFKSLDIIERRYNTLIRLQKQLLLIADAV